MGEREKGWKSLRRVQGTTISGKKRKKRAERKRKRERNKKKGREHACARSAFSARVHLSYETSLELVSHKFPQKLVSEIRHFSHPRWLPLPLPLLLFSLCPMYLPPLIRRLHRGAPFPRETCSWQKIDRENRANGKSRVLSISYPFYPWLSARITPQLSRFVLPPPLLRPPYFFFPFISIPRKMPIATARRKNRVERGRKTGRELFVFCSRFLLSAPLSISSCFLYPFEARLERSRGPWSL